MGQAVIPNKFKRRYKRSPYDSGLLFYWLAVLTFIYFNRRVMSRRKVVYRRFFQFWLIFLNRNYKWHALEYNFNWCWHHTLHLKKKTFSIFEKLLKTSRTTTRVPSSLKILLTSMRVGVLIALQFFPRFPFRHFAAFKGTFPTVRHYSHFASFWYRLCRQEHLPTRVISCQGRKCSNQKFPDFQRVVFPCKGCVSNSPGGSEPAHLRFVWHVSLSFIQKDNSSLERALVVIHLRSYYLKTCMLTALKWTSMYPLVLCAYCSFSPLCPLFLCTHCSSGPLCPLFIWSSVPTVPLVLCAHCSSGLLYPLFQLSSVPTLPLVLCAHCSSGHRLKYGLDYFFGPFLNHFMNHFMNHFIGGGEAHH